MLNKAIVCSDTIGSSAIVGDLRWGGAFGVDIDFVARGHVAVEFISLADIQVLLCLASHLTAFSVTSTRHVAADMSW